MLWKTWELIKSQRKEVEKEHWNHMSDTVMKRREWFSRRLLSYFPDIDKDLSDWPVRTKEQQRICVWNGRSLRLEVLVWIFYSLPLISPPLPHPYPAIPHPPTPRIFLCWFCLDTCPHAFWCFSSTNLLAPVSCSSRRLLWPSLPTRVPLTLLQLISVCKQYGSIPKSTPCLE